MPVMAGILTSAIKQSVSARHGDASSPAADGKVSTAKPSDRMSLLMEARRKLSSSTMEIYGALGMQPPGAGSAPCGWVQQGGSGAFRTPAPENAAGALPPSCKPWLMAGRKFPPSNGPGF